jgi:hypothetical protein
MTKRGASQGGSSSPYPEMGRTTRPRVNTPFSLRLPDDLRAKVGERAASKNLSVGQYLRDVVEADLSGTITRRRRGKYDILRQELGKIHGTIIACGNQIERIDRLCASNRCSHPSRDRCCIDQEQTIDLLKDAVSALILLARSIRAR